MMLEVQEGAIDFVLKGGSLQTAIWFKINGHCFGYLIRSKKDLIALFGETVGKSPLCQGLMKIFPCELQSIVGFVQQLYVIVFEKISQL